MNAAAIEPGSNALNTAARIAGLAVLTVAGAVAFAFAAAAALVMGLIVMGAAIGLRLSQRSKPAAAPEVLEARETAAGWVVETGARRSS